jgi:hypothetical protein
MPRRKQRLGALNVKVSQVRKTRLVEERGQNTGPFCITKEPVIEVLAFANA